MIQDSVNQMLGTIAGARFLKTANSALAKEYNEIEEFKKVPPLGTTVGKAIEMQKRQNQLAEDPNMPKEIAEKHAKKQTEIEANLKKQDEDIDAGLPKEVQEALNNAKEIRNNPENALEIAKNQLARKAVSDPEIAKQKKELAEQTWSGNANISIEQNKKFDELLKEVKGLTEVSSRVANNSTKKDLTNIVKKYEGGK